MRYEVLRSSTGFGYLIWDNEKEDFLRHPNGSLREFEDDTAARVFIDKLPTT